MRKDIYHRNHNVFFQSEVFHTSYFYKVNILYNYKNISYWRESNCLCIFLNWSRSGAYRQFFCLFYGVLGKFRSIGLSSRRSNFPSARNNVISKMFLHKNVLHYCLALERNEANFSKHILKPTTYRKGKGFFL